MREQQVPRGDGRLNHDLDPQQPGPQDACGVFGVWAPEEEVAKLTYFGLYALQHRGQEAAGIAVSDGSGVVVYKDLGLVAQVFDEPTLASLRGHVAIGHTRYSTTGGSTWENAQPTIRSTSSGTTIALAHNGNLVNTAELAREVAGTALDSDGATSDTALVTMLLASHPDLSVEAAALEVLPQLRGRVQLRLHGRDHALRGPRPARRTPAGARPAGARLGGRQRDRRAGHRRRQRGARGRARASCSRSTRTGCARIRFAAPEPKGCLFEYVYLARPDTTIAGRNVYAARVEIGRRLAKEHPVEADLVIPASRSRASPAAIGYAEASGIPYGAGLMKNAVRRADLHPAVADPASARHPAQAQPAARERARQAAGRGRRLDRARQHPAGDRADAARGRARWRCTYASPRRRSSGRASTASTSPPGPSCSPTVSTSRASAARSAPTRSGYVSLDGLIAATEQPKSRLCRACFDGEYPIELPAGQPDRQARARGGGPPGRCQARRR